MSSLAHDHRRTRFEVRPFRRRTRMLRSHRGHPLGFEPLEDRRLLSTFTVTDADDAAGSASDVTLPYVIAEAEAAGGASTIDFSPTLINISNNTISLTTSDTSAANVFGPTAFVIDNASLTIDGSQHPGLSLSGSGALRLFAVTGTGSLTLKNLTVSDGLAQGGAGADSDLGGAGGGGAGLGGAVFNDGGDFTAEGVTFTNNSAIGGAGGGRNLLGIVNGGGGGGLGGAGTSDGNPGSDGGGTGGILAGAGDPGEFGGGGGGGGASTLDILGAGAGGQGGFGGGGGGGGGAADLEPGDGAAGGFGGGAGGNGSVAVIGDGGGGGGGAGLGGAIFSNAGSITLINDTFTANSAIGGAASDGGEAGSGLGGAVFSRNASIVAIYVTFSGNTVTTGGGDDGDGSEVYVLADGNATAVPATFIDDILGQAGTSTVEDFDSDTINDGAAPDLSASSNDLVTNNPGSTGLPDAAVVATGAPLLGTLADNGGPSETMALEAGSPAIGAGIPADFPGTDNTITTDQAGYTRSPTTPDLGALTYLRAPYVEAVSPESGPITGATTVVITGTGFTGTPIVDFGSAPATFTLDSDTEITATSPAGTAGPVDVTLTNANGTSPTSDADVFTYVAVPTVSAMSPTEGPTAGGTTVTITGTGFTGATAVEFGTTPALFTVDSDTEITATSPAGAAGPVDVTVVTPEGTSDADVFTYVAAPAVSAVSPDEGPTAGGTSVTITGTDFTGATAVDFGGTPALFTVDSDTEITATKPSRRGRSGQRHHRHAGRQLRHLRCGHLYLFRHARRLGSEPGRRANRRRNNCDDHRHGLHRCHCGRLRHDARPLHRRLRYRDHCDEPSRRGGSGQRQRRHAGRQLGHLRCGRLYLRRHARRLGSEPGRRAHRRRNNCDDHRHRLHRSNCGRLRHDARPLHRRLRY